MVLLSLDVISSIVNRISRKVVYLPVRRNCDNIKAFGECPNAIIAIAYLTCSTSAVKAAGSEIAISDRTLRFSVMPAFFKPFIKVE